MYTFSFLTPTRNHLEFIERFFKSIVETTNRLDELEIVLGVDEDDPESQAITHDRLNIRKVIIPKGQNKNLGHVVQKCFEASSGRYLVQVNDDVVFHTKGWDDLVFNAFSAFPDDIALIHVNDLLYKERLCTFPIVSRKACQAIGASPTIYQRYRNDDHIYDVYYMLAFLGYRRIVYLEDVVFEHLHFITDISQHEGTYFESDNKRYYTVDDEKMKADAALYDKTLDERKKDALCLIRLIDEERYRKQQDRLQTMLAEIHPRTYDVPYIHMLSTIKDSYSYRTPDLSRKPVHIYGNESGSRRTTIAVVTANMESDYAKDCIARIKKHTHNYDLIILDNNHGGEFSHPREMNKVLRTVETEYLVMLDDDVLVEAGWLDGLHSALQQNVSVVVPQHIDKNGQISYTGAYLAMDGHGSHEHLTDAITAPREIQCVCTAMLLIDVKKCGHLFMDEIYRKYYFDLAYGLKVWEAGFSCVCTPDTVVTHLGGATMLRGSQEATRMWERDGFVFREEWVRFGRLDRLVKREWSKYPALQELIDIPARINQLPITCTELELSELDKEIGTCITRAANYHLFLNLLGIRLEQCIAVLLDKNQIDKARMTKEIWVHMTRLRYEQRADDKRRS
ncbi:glycosyltransferase family 2 protein [candidate division KSB1 bacterium]|nr:glycosyltransferase family 2 protein [candidate division KSB1 bacterium]